MSTAAAKKCLITKRNMHIYTGKGHCTVQLEPVQTRIHYTTSFFEKAGLFDPAGVLFAAGNDKAVADLQLVVHPGG